VVGGWLVLLLVGVAQVNAESPLLFPHVRSSERWVLDLLREGGDRSATFRTLVALLERTDTIVYVEPGVCAFGKLHACLSHTIAVAAGTRYLRVVFDPHRATSVQILALIGHELQHAIEIATAPSVRTPDDISRLFRRIGFSPHCPAGLPDCYETDAARLIGDRIHDELLVPRVTR
jgi:hypothetical protein